MMGKPIILLLAMSSCIAATPTIPLYRSSTLEYPPAGTQDEKITGGTDSKAGEFPWQISMQKTVRGKKMHFCGGSILNETHVITAAHCVVRQDPNRIEIVAGAQAIKDITEPSQQRIQVKQLIPNPQYNGETVSHDSALIVLALPLMFNDRVKPIRLAPLNHEPNGSCINTGWGNSNYFGTFPPIVPDQLQKVELMIIDRETCNERMGTINTVDESMICAGNGPRKGACQGDSGGPLICFDLDDGEPYLAGIVSWGLPWCGIAYTVFGHVSFLRPFLDGSGSNTPAVEQGPQPSPIDSIKF